MTDDWTNWCGRLRHTRVSGRGQGVVNMTAPDGLGNAEATAFLVNLWTAWQHQSPQCIAPLQPVLNMIPLRKGAIKRPRYVTWARYQNRNSKLRMTCLLGGVYVCLAWPVNRYYLDRRRLTADATSWKGSLTDEQGRNRPQFTKNKKKVSVFKHEWMKVGGVGHKLKHLNPPSETLMKVYGELPLCQSTR